MIRVRDTRVSTYKILKPEDCSKGIVRVGPLLKFMDICACLSAERLSNAPSVTLSMDTLTFEAEAYEGDTVCVLAQVTRAFNTSVEILVVVVNEDLERTICSAFFVFVSLRDGKKVPLPSAFPETELEQINFVAANDRRTARINAVQLLEHTKKSFCMKETMPTHGSRPSSVGLSSSVSSADVFGRGGTYMNTNKSDVEVGINGGGGEANSAAEEERDGTTAGSASDQQPSISVSVPSLEDFVRADESLIMMTQCVLPPHANHMGNTFGGQIMEWCEETALLSARKFIKAYNRKVINGRGYTNSDKKSVHQAYKQKKYIFNLWRESEGYHSGSCSSSGYNPNRSRNSHHPPAGTGYRIRPVSISRHSVDTGNDFTSVSVVLRTIAVDSISFVNPSTVGDRVVLRAQVHRTFGDKLEVGVVVSAVDVSGTNTRHLNTGYFLVAAEVVQRPPDHEVDYRGRSYHPDYDSSHAVSSSLSSQSVLADTSNNSPFDIGSSTQSPVEVVLPQVFPVTDEQRKLFLDALARYRLRLQGEKPATPVRGPATSTNGDVLSNGTDTDTSTGTGTANASRRKRVGDVPMIVLDDSNLSQQAVMDLGAKNIWGLLRVGSNYLVESQWEHMPLQTDPHYMSGVLSGRVHSEKLVHQISYSTDGTGVGTMKMTATVRADVDTVLRLILDVEGRNQWDPSRHVEVKKKLNSRNDILRMIVRDPRHALTDNNFNNVVSSKSNNSTSGDINIGAGNSNSNSNSTGNDEGDSGGGVDKAIGQSGTFGSDFVLLRSWTRSTANITSHSHSSANSNIRQRRCSVSDVWSPQMASPAAKSISPHFHTTNGNGNGSGSDMGGNFSTMRVSAAAVAVAAVAAVSNTVASKSSALPVTAMTGNNNNNSSSSSSNNNNTPDTEEMCIIAYMSVLTGEVPESPRYVREHVLPSGYIVSTSWSGSESTHLPSHSESAVGLSIDDNSGAMNGISSGGICNDYKTDEKKDKGSCTVSPTGFAEGAHDTVDDLRDTKDTKDMVEGSYTGPMSKVSYILQVSSSVMEEFSTEVEGRTCMMRDSFLALCERMEEEYLRERMNPPEE